tara:strand:- start:7 stop:609 length:603 start_codon:yes stop_codon:yes gene_type:complete
VFLYFLLQLSYFKKMNLKILIVYEYQILFEILNEIQDILNFKIIKSEKNDYKDIKFDPKINYLTISKKKAENINNNLVLDIIPIKLEKLLETINISFLKNKFNNQSNIKVGKYNLDLNARKIKFKNKFLDLTERETSLLIFINDKMNVTVKELQKNVWDYSTNLETHTVETHIYRLRKKMKDFFDDENFILNTDKGYSIN